MIETSIIQQKVVTLSLSQITNDHKDNMKNKHKIKEQIYVVVYSFVLFVSYLVK